MDAKNNQYMAKFRYIVSEFIRIADIVDRSGTLNLPQCGCCGCFHPPGFDGDCRDDHNRFSTEYPFDDVVAKAKELLHETR